MDKLPPREVSPEMSREKEPRHVVRIFLSQSRSMGDIMRTKNEMQTAAKEGKVADYTRLFFTTVLWAEKSKESIQNKGQVMPVGGNVEAFDKNLMAAAMREVLEETHLRVLNLKEFEHDLDYTLHTGKKGDIDVEQTFFFGNVLPTDSPYPLDPVEDKIETFHALSLEEMGALFVKKIPKGDGRMIEMLGNLRLPLKTVAQDKKISRTPAEADKALHLFAELAQRSHTRERKKREEIMKHVYAYLTESVSDPQLDTYMAELLAIDTIVEQQPYSGEKFYTHQRVFQKLCTYLDETYGHEFNTALATAIEASNFEEEIVEPQSKESYVEAIMHVIYTLLETKSEYDIFLDIAEKNKSITSFIKKLKSFVEKLTEEIDEDNHGSYKQKDFKHKLSSLAELDTELIADVFYEAFDMDEKNINTRLLYVNNFLSTLVRRAFVSHIGGENYKTDAIDTSNEIAGADIGQLISYAFPFGDQSWKKRFDGSPRAKDEIKRFVFEARRQLALVYLYAETDAYYDQVREKGIAPIESVWNIASGPMHVVHTHKKIDAQRQMIDVDVVYSSDEEDENNYDDVSMRKIKLNDNPAFLANTSVRVKDRDSLYRKIIERGYDSPTRAQDIYGRSFVLAADPEDSASYDYIRKRETRRLRVDGEIRECHDVAPLLDIMEHMTKQPHVEIVQYTPTPKEGEAFSSKGIGGGSKIRLGKFYIRHTDEKGIIRHEEVQVFSPSPSKTAFYWYEQKKHDDKRYYFERLMNTKGFHSVLELLFPTALYGDAMNKLRNMHTKRKKSDKRKR